MFPGEHGAEIFLDSWPILPIFTALEKYGEIPSHEMYEIFNMGIGMVLAVSQDKVQIVQDLLQEQGETAYVIGQVTDNQGQAILFREAQK